MWLTRRRPIIGQIEQCQRIRARGQLWALRNQKG